MPRIVTRSVAARRAKAMRLNWRTVVMDTQGWRQSNSAKMSGMGFCSSCVGVVVGATQQLYYKSPFPSHFGEGIVFSHSFVKTATPSPIGAMALRLQGLGPS